MTTELPDERVLILDFGSQYTQLIARRIRECRVYCEIWPFSRSIEDVRAFDPRAIVLSGGPASLAAGEESPRCDKEILHLDVPILGICYGMQLLASELGGQVSVAERREFGPAEITVDGGCDLFRGLADGGRPMKVWMSHGDRVEALPDGFEAVAESSNAPSAAMASTEGTPRFGVQFHPEVVHTPRRRANSAREFPVLEISRLSWRRGRHGLVHRAIDRQVARIKKQCRF